MRLLVAALLLCLFLSPARAQGLYDGMWYDASRAGMGLQVTHTGDSVFAVWFTYDSSGNPIWYTMGGNLARGAMVADLYAYTANPMSSNYNPGTARPVSAGSGMLIFSSASSGTLTYHLGPKSGVLALTRFAIAIPDASGTYLGGAWPQSGTCGGQPYNAVYSIAQSGQALSITEQSNFGTCTFSGVVAPVGSKLSLSGTFSCTNGNAGVIGSNEIWVTPHSVTFAGSLRYTAPGTCTMTGVIGGLK